MSSEKVTKLSQDPSSKPALDQESSSAYRAIALSRGHGAGHASRMGHWRGSHLRINPGTTSRAPGGPEQAGVRPTDGPMQAPGPRAQLTTSMATTGPLIGQTQAIPAHAGMLNPLQLAREIGRMEKMLEESNQRAIYAETQAARLRTERDDARHQLEALSIKLNEASGTIMSLERRLQQALSSPAPLPAHPYRGPNPNIRMPVQTYNIAPPPHSTIQQHSPVYQQPPSSQIPTVPQKSVDTRRFSMISQRGSQIVAPNTLAGRNVSVVHAMPIAPVGSIKEALIQLFDDAETWAEKHATIPVTDNPHAPILPPDLTEIQSHATRIWNDRSFTDLLKNTGWRKPAIAAVIISKVMDVISGEVFNQYPIGQNEELEEVMKGLSNFKQTALAEHHALLVRRTRIYRHIASDAEFKIWVSHQVTYVANDLNVALSPLVQMPNRDKGLAALREMIKAAYGIGVGMMVEKPCEWVIHRNRRGAMYEPGQMVVRNPELKNDPRLARKGAGEEFRVRLLISPSITEREFSSGKIMTRELQRSIVLVYEKERQTRSEE